MKILLLLASCLALRAQILSPIAFSNSVAAGGSVTYVGSGALLGPCTNGTLTCSFTYSFTGGTGHTGLILPFYCTNSGCSAGAFTTIVASDSSNTWTTATCASPSSSGYQSSAMTAPNVASGSTTITLTATGTGVTFDFATIYVMEVTGANSATPVDVGACKAINGTGSSISLAPNVSYTNANEIAFGFIAGSGAVTLTGSFSSINTSVSNITLVDLVHPTSGATTPISGTQTSGQYGVVLVAITP